ncbi:MAG TPA: ribonuclease HII [Bacteroidales bacterium]|nr:ribonuclease HII [Bacteroidales bacterium]
MSRLPLQSNFSGHLPEAGCDEAGRGCLAGPVFAAAVILPDKPSPYLETHLDDSKTLSTSKRKLLRLVIEKEAVAFAVSMVEPAKIDRVNILNASIEAMHHALEQLQLVPEFIIVDGNRFRKFGNIPHQCIVQGDKKYLAIAAASVLAKTWRDEYMNKLHDEFPAYNWKRNKGYPTAAHLQALRTHGPCRHHRMSFKPVGQLAFHFIN